MSYWCVLKKPLQYLDSKESQLWTDKNLASLELMMKKFYIECKKFFANALGFYMEN